MELAVSPREKLTLAGGFRYRNSRRAELYREVIGRAHNAKLSVAWMGEGYHKNEAEKS